MGPDSPCRGALVVRAETLPSGLRLVTETIPHVRSVAVGVWLKRGSRHESDAEAGIAHFVEHMLFKGTTTRSAQVIAQTIDSIGGQLDAFTAKEYAGYYIKVLDEHLPLAIELLADMVMRPALAPADVEREQGVILEEIKMVEDAPDDLVHEVFAPAVLGPSSAGASHSRHAGDRQVVHVAAAARRTSIAPIWRRTSPSPPLATSITDHLRATGERARSPICLPARLRGRPSRPSSRPGSSFAKRTSNRVTCVSAHAGVPQAHADRHALFLMNTILGGSMSSRLFQHIREDRGLAYAVWSSLISYSDAGALTIYAGCAVERVARGRSTSRWPSSQCFVGGRDRRGTAPRQGPPQGQPDAEPGEHIEPHVAVGAAGADVRAPVHDGRDSRVDRGVSADDVLRVSQATVSGRRRRGDGGWARSCGALTMDMLRV